MELEMKHHDYMTTLLQMVKRELGVRDVREIINEQGGAKTLHTLKQGLTRETYIKVVSECRTALQEEGYTGAWPVDPDQATRLKKPLKSVVADGDFNEVVVDYQSPDPFAAAARARRVWPRETLTIALKAFYRVDDESQFNQMQYDRMRETLDALQETDNETNKALTAEVTLLTETLREANDELDKQKETVSKLRLRTAERDASAARAMGRLAK